MAPPLYSLEFSSTAFSYVDLYEFMSKPATKSFIAPMISLQFCARLASQRLSCSAITPAHHFTTPMELRSFFARIPITEDDGGTLVEYFTLK